MSEDKKDLNKTNNMEDSSDAKKLDATNDVKLEKSEAKIKNANSDSLSVKPKKKVSDSKNKELKPLDGEKIKKYQIILIKKKKI